VNVRDRKGFTPLQHALRGPRNRECAVILLESGAQFDVDIFETDYGTLLHEMYVQCSGDFEFSALTVIRILLLQLFAYSALTLLVG